MAFASKAPIRDFRMPGSQCEESEEDSERLNEANRNSVGTATRKPHSDHSDCWWWLQTQHGGLHQVP